MTAPAHALDGCGPGGRFSHSQQRCVRRTDVFRNPQKQWAADQSCGYRYRYSARLERCVFRRDVRTVRLRSVPRRRLVTPVRVIHHRQPVLRLNFSFKRRINIDEFTPLSRVGLLRLDPCLTIAEAAG